MEIHEVAFKQRKAHFYREGRILEWLQRVVDSSSLEIFKT